MEHSVVFVRVVQAGSFTKAAALLGMPKSTVSRKVAELEQRLGARLLQRTTRTLGLTDVGRTYHEHWTRLVAEVEEAENAVHRLQATPRGKLRMTAPLSFSFLGPIAAELLRRYPEIELEVVATDRVVDLVEEGFDLAIRAGRLADSTLVARSLGTMRRLVVASPEYLKRRGLPRTPDDLARHDGILFAGQDAAGWRLEAGGRKVGAKVRARLVVNDLDMVREAAVAGLGIALLPIDRCSPDLRERRLRRVLADWCSPVTPIHVVYPSTRHLSPKVTALLELLRERMDPPPWESPGRPTGSPPAAGRRARRP
jgi:DNA-binding transcriptional LysR family regulator